jgi:hypothetical protein
MVEGMTKTVQVLLAVLSIGLGLFTLFCRRSEENKIPIIDEKALEFEVLGGPTYSKDDRPPFWKNEIPLRVDGMVRHNPPPMDRLPFAFFPLIKDFEVRLEVMKYRGEPELAAAARRIGYNVRFFSPARGYIADFAWWDHAERDLIRDDFRIPLGDLKDPYSDSDQGWEINIVSRDDYVYILEGNADAPVDEGYSSWFKVNMGTYLAEWQKAIELCRKTFVR